MNHMVSIPEAFLIYIAAAGKMGSGDLLLAIQNWAQRECDRLVLNEKLKEMQIDMLDKMRVNVKNILGENKVSEIEKAIKETCSKYLNSENNDKSE